MEHCTLDLVQDTRLHMAVEKGGGVSPTLAGKPYRECACDTLHPNIMWVGMQDNLVEFSYSGQSTQCDLINCNLKTARFV